MTKNITIYDTTLRDGTQGEGVQVAVEDKLRLTRIFDEVGFDFIEAGWPGSNPRDAEFSKWRGHIDLTMPSLLLLVPPVALELNAMKT